MHMSRLNQLPEDLPIPKDDGTCRHLPGFPVPTIKLSATTGQSVDICAESHQQRVVIYCYPMTGQPDKPLPEDWDMIPGARGCTPQSCAFRDHHTEIKTLGASVYGLSTQSTDYQQEMVTRLHLPFPILSDEQLLLAKALQLPTFSVDDMTLIKRLTLILYQGFVEHVFYPVFPPNKNAAIVIQWLQEN